MFAVRARPPEGDPAILLAESLANLAGLYRAFGFAQGDKLPLRTDHIAYELEFMSWLISQQRLASRMALFDRQAAEQAARCDLAQTELL